ncbi:MAG TPA: hypothetical protein VK195_20130, partial [Burkholderiaceae bacterium]|nr:hypothetical protein [Burkholderiaceae bacterium]
PGPLLSASQLPDNMSSAPDIRPRLVQRPDGASAPALREAQGAARHEGREAGKEVGKAPGRNAAKEASKEARPADQVIDRANSAGPTLRAPAVVRPAMKIEHAPLRSSEGGRHAASEAASAPGEPVSAAETLKRPAGKSRDPATRSAGTDNAPLVALVGPPMASQAEAEAYLLKMQPLIQPLVGRKALEQQVLQTPEGWRAAVWPFASREEAQLINAMLVARGLRTRAVDF